MKKIIAISSLLSLVFGQVDYHTQVQPIFDANCSGCHGGTAGVTLSSYSAVMSSSGNNYGTLIVSAGDAVNSPLYDKVRLDKSPDHGDRMPKGGALTQDQVDIIMNWINEGALEASVGIFSDLVQPQSFELHGNFPNPFNPETNIDFSLQQLSTVELQVYDVRGNLVLERSSQFASGSHQVSLNMSERPSGIYFYSITMTDAAGQHDMRSGKMTLLK